MRRSFQKKRGKLRRRLITALVVLAFLAVGSASYSKGAVVQGWAEDTFDSLPKPTLNFLPLTATSSKADIAAAGKQLLATGWVNADRPRCQADNGDGPREDLESGNLYYKGIVFLQYAASAGFKLGLSCVKSGHDDDGLLHPRWKAYDVNLVNGHVVSSHDSMIRRFGRWIKNLPHDQQPFMVGGPTVAIDMDQLKHSGSDRRGPFFTDSGHQDHFHIGFECRPGNRDFRDCYSNDSEVSLAAAYRAAPWL